jgi:hypothetical protein
MELTSLDRSLSGRQRRLAARLQSSTMLCWRRGWAPVAQAVSKAGMQSAEHEHGQCMPAAHTCTTWSVVLSGISRYLASSWRPSSLP